MKPLLFVPLTADELRALRGGSLRAGQAYAATEALRRAYDLGPADDEEADHAAQVLASLACVRAGVPRLVAAAEVSRLPTATDDPLGAVAPLTVAWRDIRALFIDDPDEPPTDAVLAEAVGGDLGALAAHPLLWFAPSEVDHVLDQLTAPHHPEGA